MLDSLCGVGPADIENLCAVIGRMFGVDRSGVGLLKVRGLTLEFVYPFALKSSGRIAVTSPAVAARTATTRKSELFNSFANVSHNSVFELVPLADCTRAADPLRIQKLMTAPVLDSNKAIGVIQIARKGTNPDEAGPDFTEQDMEKLNRIAQRIAPFLINF